MRPKDAFRLDAPSTLPSAGEDGPRPPARRPRSNGHIGFYSCCDGTARALAALVGPARPDVARGHGGHDGRRQLGAPRAGAGTLTGGPVLRPVDFAHERIREDRLACWGRMPIGLPFH